LAFVSNHRLQVGCGPTANYLFCFVKKDNPKKATVDSPLRGAYATLQHNLCITKNGKVLKLAFGFALRNVRLQANTVPQARRMRLETPAAPQTTTLSYPFSVTHKLHRLERG